MVCEVCNIVCAAISHGDFAAHYTLVAVFTNNRTHTLSLLTHSLTHLYDSICDLIQINTSLNYKSVILQCCCQSFQLASNPASGALDNPFISHLTDPSRGKQYRTNYFRDRFTQMS